MGRLPSPSRPDRRHASVAWSACTVCLVLLAVLIACTWHRLGGHHGSPRGDRHDGADSHRLSSDRPPRRRCRPHRPPTPTPLPPTATAHADAAAAHTDRPRRRRCHPRRPPTPDARCRPQRPPTPTPLPPTPTAHPDANECADLPPSLILYPTVSPQDVHGHGRRERGAGHDRHDITRVNWNWGDGVIEDHAVPNTHTYAGAGSSTITVTAFQSDGQSTTRSMTVFVSGPTEATTAPTTAPPATTTQPPATVLPTPSATAGPPVLSLNPPLVDNQTVMIAGSIQPGGPGAVIDLVIWDWGDGIRDTQTHAARDPRLPRGRATTRSGSRRSRASRGAGETPTATTSFPVSITQVPATYTSATTPGRLRERLPDPRYPALRAQHPPPAPDPAGRSADRRPVLYQEPRGHRARHPDH